MTCVSRCQPRLDKEAVGVVDILFVAFSVSFYFWTPKIMVAAYWGDLTVHSWRPSECKLRKLFLLYFSIPYRITYHFTDVAQIFWLILQSKAYVIRRHES